MSSRGLSSLPDRRGTNIGGRRAFFPRWHGIPVSGAAAPVPIVKKL